MRRPMPPGAVWFAAWVTVLIAALVVGGLVVGNVADARDRDRERIDALSRGLTAANDRLAELDQPTQPAPEQIVDEPEVVETTTTLPPTSTVPAATIRAAVDRWLRDNPPADGRPPTTEEIVSAVVAVCTATGGCNGRDGRDAPAPTAAQIQAAVAAYCSDGRCRGSRGEPGAAGVDGVSPPCLATPEQCVGPAGPQGGVGPQGGPGPAPASWTFTVGLTTYTCVDSNGDLAYECTGQTVLPP